MDNKEFDKALFELNYNNTEASKFIGISRQTIIKYLKSESEIPLWLGKFMAIALENKILKEQLKVKGSKEIK